MRVVSKTRIADGCALVGICTFTVAAVLPGQPFLATAFYGCVLAWLPRLILLRGVVGIALFRSGLLPLFATLLLWLALASLISETPLAGLNYLRRHHLRALVVAVIAADVLRDLQRLRWFCGFLTCLAFALCGLETVEISRILQKQAAWVLTYGSNSVREYGPGIVFCLPFMLILALQTKPTDRHRAWLVLGLLYAALMIALTGSRGAWAAAFCGVAIVAIIASLRGKWKVLFAFVPIIAIFAALAQTPLGSQMIQRGITLGFNATDRITTTWGPGYEMVANRPVLGHGTGPERFHTEFRQLRPSRPWWLLAESIGPHSMYLEVAFAGGLPALLLLLATLARALTLAHRACREARGVNLSDAHSVDTSLIACALLASLVSSYLVFGFVESLLWEPLGILLGAIVACNAVTNQELPITAPRTG